jgi:hypothetical protein
MNFTFLLFDAVKIAPLLFVFLLIGKFLYGNLNIRHTDSFSKTFIEIFFGFILTVAGYAIIKTGGKSILSLFFLLLTAQYFVLKIKPDIFFIRKINKTDMAALGLLMLFFILFFVVQLYRYDYFNRQIVNLGWGDYGFYSDLAENLNIYGLEQTPNWYFNFNSSYVSYNLNPVPYHYFEIWTQAFLLFFSSAKGIFVFIYIFTPFVGMMVSGSFLLLAYSSLKKDIKLKNVLIIFTAFIFTFFVGKIPFKLGGLEDNSIFYPRVYLFISLIIFFIVFYKNQLKNAGLFFIGLISFLNILYVPTTASVIILLALFQFFVLKQKKRAICTFILGISVAIGSLIFYFVLFKTKSSVGINTDSFFPLKDYILRGLRYFFRLNIMRLWFFNLPLTIFVVYYLFTKLKNKSYDIFRNEIIFLAVFLELVSLFLASFFPHFESGTFNSIVLNPLVGIFTFIAIFHLISAEKAPVRKIILSLLYAQAIYSAIFVIFNLSSGSYIGNSFNRHFMNELAKEKISNKTGAFITDTSRFKESIFANNTNLSWFTSVFDVIGNGHAQVSLSAPINQDSIPFKEIKAYVMHSPMFKYGDAKRQENSGISRKEVDIQFVKDFGIEYIVVYPGAAIPEYITPLIKKIIADDVSGLKILFLKP